MFKILIHTNFYFFKRFAAGCIIRSDNVRNVKHKLNTHLHVTVKTLNNVIKSRQFAHNFKVKVVIQLANKLSSNAIWCASCKRLYRAVVALARFMPSNPSHLMKQCKISKYLWMWVTCI